MPELMDDADAALICAPRDTIGLVNLALREVGLPAAVRGERLDDDAWPATRGLSMPERQGGIFVTP